VPTTLEDYSCTQVGRHSIALFRDEVYFGYNCSGGALVLRLEEGDGSGASDATVVFDSAEAFDTGLISEEIGGFPTAAVLDGNLYMFANGVVLRSEDGETWESVTIADLPASVPLEATRQVEDDDGNSVIYLPFVTGQVYEFDGETITLIGEDYLGETSNVSNLPSIGYLAGAVYVGNANMTDGAKLKQWDGEGATTWTDVVDYATEDSNNVIINKMLNSQKFSSDRYLVFFTANGSTGVEVASVDADGNYLQLIDDGLGGTDSSNNSEVLTAIRQDTAGTPSSQPVILFSTKPVDTAISETKIYILQMSTKFAANPALNYFNEDVEFARAALSGRALLKKDRVGELTEGEELIIHLPRKAVKRGYRYYLYVDGEEVYMGTATRGKLTLTYEDAAELEEGDTFSIRIGTEPAYGPAGDKLYSTKTVKGRTRSFEVVAAE
jgi:hypothetical protein